MSQCDEQRTIKFSDRVSCPKHGPVMVLIRHELSVEGKHLLKGAIRTGCVTFYRCTGMVEVVGPNGNYHTQCTFMRPNKYQIRAKGERHK
jgi:hypothetical protein